MLDLDIGMNERLTPPLQLGRLQAHGSRQGDDRRRAGSWQDFGRYLDVDGDGIPYRTYPGTHPTRGSFFTRGTSKDPYARYTERGEAYEENMQRLLRKFATAAKLVPAPQTRLARAPTRFGAIYYGSTSAAMLEAAEMLAEQRNRSRSHARPRLSLHQRGPRLHRRP